MLKLIIANSTEIITTITMLVGILFSWHKIQNPMSYFKKKKVDNLIAIINCDHINKNLQDFAKEQLQVEYFSYVFNLKGSAINITFIEEALNLIKKSEDTITIDDIKNTGLSIVLSGKKLTMKHPWADKFFLISLAIMTITSIILTYFLFTTEAGLELTFHRVVALPILLFIIALLSKFWINVKSVDRIKKHLTTIKTNKNE